MSWEQLETQLAHLPDYLSSHVLLTLAALAAGIGRFCDADALAAWQLRLHFARSLDASLPEVGEAEVSETLRELCIGRASFAELRQADLLACVRARLDHAQGRRLEALAPSHAQLAGRRRCPISGRSHWRGG